jgi:hypothetical protein
MKRISLLLLAGILTLAGFAQDKVINDANAEARSAGSFHAIKISHGIELVLQQGNAEAVAVSAVSADVRDNIKTEVVGGILKIYFDTKWYKNWNAGGKKLKAYVSFKDLDLLDASSGSSTTVNGNLCAGTVKIELSSGAGFKGSVEAGSLRVDGSSGAIAHISGTAGSASLEASSGAMVYGYELLSDKCDADASSGGGIQVSVNKELAAEASSGGDIRYKGAGVITRVSTGSGGSVKKNG